MKQHEQDQPSGYAPCLLHEVTNCSICSGLDKQRAKDDREPDGPVIAARHPGKCAICGEPFDVGRAIRHFPVGWAPIDCEEL